MARKTVRVGFVKTNADDLINVMNRVIEKHALLGDKSPLKAAEVSSMKTLVSQAATERKKAKVAEEQAQSFNNTANNFLGIAKGQNTDSAGTGLFLLTGMRDTLLKEFRGEEEKLSEWGFNVVVGQAKSPARKPKPTA